MPRATSGTRTSRRERYDGGREVESARCSSQSDDLSDGQLGPICQCHGQHLGRERQGGRSTMVAGRSSEHGNPLRPRDRIHPGGAKMTPILRVLLSAAVLTGAAHAQSALGTITGSITDPSGSAVPNAKVMGRNVGTNVERHVTA